jgi:hypothetical protein
MRGCCDPYYPLAGVVLISLGLTVLVANLALSYFRQMQKEREGGDINPKKNNQTCGATIVREWKNMRKELSENPGCNEEEQIKEDLLEHVGPGSAIFKNLEKEEAIASGSPSKSIVDSNVPLFEDIDPKELATLKISPELDKELASLGWTPKIKVSLDEEVICYISVPVHVKSRFVVSAFIKIGENDPVQRFFYNSKSQGIWRVLPSAVFNQIDGGIRWWGKGKQETDTQLPIKVTLALAELASPIRRPKVCRGTPGIIRQKVKEGSGPADSYIANTELTQQTEKFSKETRPDFGNCLYTKELKHLLYGKMTAHVFLSRDKSLQYLFYKYKDKAFLASIEKVNEPINTYGIRSKSLQTKLDSPLLEYKEQMLEEDKPQEGNQRDPFDPYEWNWNGVRKLWVIKKYFKQYLKIDLPPTI